MAKGTIEVKVSELPQVKAALKAAAEAIELRDQALYTAWTIIANAYVNASPGPETGWAAAPAEWREAAERWRDEQFHPLLGDGGERVAEAGDTGPLPPRTGERLPVWCGRTE